MANSIRDDGYFENEEKLYGNVKSLSVQNPLLGETLERILLHIEYVEEGICGSLTENAQEMSERLQTEVMEFIEEVAKDSAQYESEELRRRLDRMFERHSREIDALYAWRHRVDEERAARTEGPSKLTPDQPPG